MVLESLALVLQPPVEESAHCKHVQQFFQQQTECAEGAEYPDRIADSWLANRKLLLVKPASVMANHKKNPPAPGCVTSHRAFKVILASVRSNSRCLHAESYLQEMSIDVDVFLFFNECKSIFCGEGMQKY